MSQGSIKLLITAIMFGSSAIFIIYGIQTGIFYSQEALQSYLSSLGVWSPLIFILFQAVQVVIPVLPGGIGLLGGVVAFGPATGFVYNYIGICLGSIAAFLVARHYGTYLIEMFFSVKVRAKYADWTNNSKFNHLFAVAIFMPIAPDDFLCYLAGTTSMSLRRFITIILLGKPLAIAAYSYGLSVVFSSIIKLFN